MSVFCALNQNDGKEGKIQNPLPPFFWYKDPVFYYVILSKRTQFKIRVERK